MWTSNAVVYYKSTLILLAILTNPTSQVKPVHQQKYAIIINAGSSGSRMVIFEWTEIEIDDPSLPKYQIMEDKSGDVIIKVDGGIDKFHDNLSGISPYLKKMLDVAFIKIPEKSHRDTQLYLFATAGMRLISIESQTDIYKKVAEVFGEYDFHFDTKNIKTLDGMLEGMYAWVAVNFMKNTFMVCNYIPVHRPHEHQKSMTETYGVIDMGGASAQMVFEMQSHNTKTYSKMHMRFNIKRRVYDVYSHSYLGMGMDQSRKRYERNLLFNHIEENKKTEYGETLTIEDPCLPASLIIDTTQAPIHKDDWTSSENSTNTYAFKIKGTGKADECLQSNNLMMSNKNNECYHENCAINGTIQPTTQFKDKMYFIAIGSTFMALSDIGFKQGDVYNYTHIMILAKNVCEKDWLTTLEELKRDNPDYSEKQKNFKMYECYAAMYVISFLHQGLHAPIDYTAILPVMTLDEQEIHWPLGALIYEQESSKHKLDIAYE